MMPPNKNPSHPMGPIRIAATYKPIEGEEVLIQKSPTVIVIPARMGSTRLFGKPLLLIGDKILVQHVWEKAIQVPSADKVIVATDHEDIAGACQSFGAEVAMTSTLLESGTDRVAAATKALPFNSIVVNLQGDLPFVNPVIVEELIRDLMIHRTSAMSTPCNRRHYSDKAWMQTDVVKVVKDRNGKALYFSRSPIPWNIVQQGYWLHHFGIYAVRSQYLQAYTTYRQSDLELAEGLEQLRYLQAGYSINIVETLHQAGIEINTERDLEEGRTWYEKNMETAA